MLTIRQSPTANLAHEEIEPQGIGEFPCCVAEVELREIPIQVLRRNVVVRSVKRPFQLRKVILGFVRGYFATHVLTSNVIDRLVIDELPRKRLVDLGAVSVKGRTTLIDVLCNDFIKDLGGDPLDNGATNLARFGIDKRNNRGLFNLRDSLTMLADNELAPVHIADLATDPSLVRYNRTGEESARSLTHRLAESVSHKPCGARGNTILALNFPSSNAVLVGAHLKDHKEPDPKRHLGTVYNGAGGHAELLTALTALPNTALGNRTSTGLASLVCLRSKKVVLSDRATMRANDAVFPSQRLHIPVCLVLGGDLVGESGNCDLVHTHMIRQTHGFVKSVHL